MAMVGQWPGKGVVMVWSWRGNGVATHQPHVWYGLQARGGGVAEGEVVDELHGVARARAPVGGFGMVAVASAILTVVTVAA